MQMTVLSFHVHQRARQGAKNALVINRISGLPASAVARDASKDEIFREIETVADFSFGEKVASVFDDMLDRSVPFYQEIQRMIWEMAADFAVPGTNIYDLGCSTGNTLLNLETYVGPDVKFIGVDYSEEMLKRCRQKLAERGLRHECELVCTDL